MRKKLGRLATIVLLGAGVLAALPEIRKIVANLSGTVARGAHRALTLEDVAAGNAVIDEFGNITPYGPRDTRGSNLSGSNRNTRP